MSVQSFDSNRALHKRYGGRLRGVTPNGSVHGKLGIRLRGLGDQAQSRSAGVRSGEKGRVAMPSAQKSKQRWSEAEAADVSE